MTDVCLAAAERMAEEGVGVEVLDLRTILPYDEEPVAESVDRTGRLVIAPQAVRSGGFGAEVVSRVAESRFWSLDAPVARVATPFAPMPYARELEQMLVPHVDGVVAAIRRTLHQEY